MTKGFACDTDEMRALITTHEALRSDLERVVVPPQGATWGFSSCVAHTRSWQRIAPIVAR